LLAASKTDKTVGHDAKVFLEACNINLLLHSEMFLVQFYGISVALLVTGRDQPTATSPEGALRPVATTNQHTRIYATPMVAD
jgi:hypothetical protein